MTDVSFDCMGTRRAPRRRATLDAARAFLERFEAALSRFRPGSELCALNADPRHRGPRLAAAARPRSGPGCGRPSARGGLVDPTLAAALEVAGYDRDRRAPELPLARGAGERPARAAAPRPTRGARLAAGCASTRPRGSVRAARRAARHGRHRQGTRGRPARRASSPAAAAGPSTAAATCACYAPADEPFDVEVAHPLTGEVAHRFRLTAGAVATSGLDVRLWRRSDGRRGAPPARPGDGRAGVDRPGRRHGARPDRARGRGARQGRAAERSARAPTAGCAATAASPCARTARSSSTALCARGRSSGSRWPHDRAARSHASARARLAARPRAATQGRAA